MARCNHPAVIVTIDISRTVLATIHAAGSAEVKTDVPKTIRVAVTCLDCGYNNVETTYSDMSGPWSRWPKWLKDRLNILRHTSKPLDEALTALAFGAPV